MLLSTGGAYVLEEKDEPVYPYTCINIIVVVDLLNACLEAQVGPMEIKKLKKSSWLNDVVFDKASEENNLPNFD